MSVVQAGTVQVLNFEVDLGAPVTPSDLVVIALDKELRRAPTSLAVSVNGAEADETLTFKIDGTTVATDDADSDGNMQQISLPVDVSFLAGSHTVSVESATKTGSDTFTLLLDPITTPVTQGLDTDPVLIPEALNDAGVYHWVLQDLMPGGLGSWIMPINPASMTSPGIEVPIAVKHSTAVVSGQYLMWQGGPEATEWSFSGFCPDQEFYEHLTDYAALTRRFYIIDHRNRAWKVAITGLDMVARLRGLDEAGNPQDWRHDYTVRTALYQQNPLVPV